MSRPAPPTDAAVRALRESEERFRLLVESVRDYAIFLLDPGGYVISWNTGAQRIKGYTADEILGRHFSIFYPPDRLDVPAVELQEALANGRVEDEGWRLRKNGERFWANVIITALFDETGTHRGFAKVTRDLTERLQREEAERQAALHEEASRMKDDFLAIVSHELRTPLNVVVGQAALLERGSVAPDNQPRAWASLQRNLKLLTKIIDDLLDVSRVVTGKLALERARFDLRPLVQSAVEEVLPSAQAKGLTVRQALDGPPAVVIGDAARLRQVVANLLANAVKFTASGGWIAVECSVADGAFVLRVSDSGVGIEPKFLESVFERFSQADTTTKREHAGLGLGLAIVRELVTRHDGTVTAASPGRGRGATFEVRLPLAT